VISVKICIPTEGDKGADEQICPHFGRAPTFTIVDLEKDELKVIANNGSHMGGSLLPPEIIKGAGAEVMLVSGLGTKAVDLFQDLNIEVFVGANGTVAEAIEAWKSGELVRATRDAACQEHHH